MEPANLRDPVRVKELVSYCERYDELNQQGVRDGFFSKVDLLNPVWTGFWQRFYDLQWQQYEAYMAKRLTRQVYGPWLRQRRLNFRCGLERVRSVTRQLSYAHRANRTTCLVDGSHELLVSVEHAKISGLASRIEDQLNELSMLDAGRVALKVFPDHDLPESEHQAALLSDSDAGLRELDVIRRLKCELEQLAQVLEGRGKGMLHKSMLASIDEQRAYREGWHFVAPRSYPYMRSFAVDIRSIMMSETDARIDQILDSVIS